MIGQPVAVLVPSERLHELRTVARRVNAGEGVEPTRPEDCARTEPRSTCR